MSDKLTQAKLTQRKNFDRQASKDLLVLQKGEVVRMKHGKDWIPVTLSSKHLSPRSYVVQIPDRRKYRRNQRHLNRCKVRGDTPSEAILTKLFDPSDAILMPSTSNQREKPPEPSCLNI